MAREHLLRCCSSLGFTSGVKPIIILHPIVEKWSVPSYVARGKLKLPRLSAMIQSNTKTTTSKNVLHSSRTGKKWLTCALKSKYRPWYNFNGKKPGRKWFFFKYQYILIQYKYIFFEYKFLLNKNILIEYETIFFEYKFLLNKNIFLIVLIE